MADKVLEGIRRQRAAVNARLQVLAKEVESLQGRLAALEQAEAALVANPAPKAQVLKDAARAPGGYARARAISAERRSEIARAGAAARWKRATG